MLLKIFLAIPILSPAELEQYLLLKSSLEYGPKNMETCFESRDGRHLAADCYECKTSKQFFKIKYRLPLMKKLFLAKGQKIIELPYELHHVFVMMIAYPHKNSLIQ